MRCDHCAHDVPDGIFCTRCGAEQGTPGLVSIERERAHHYAAQPSEHVASPGLFSTLFPHLSPQEVNSFRWALVVALAVLVGLYLSGLILAAILTAAFMVPAIYLIYLYEARVYRDAPLVVVGITLGGGLIVGTAVTIAVTSIIDRPMPTVVGAASFGSIVALAVLVPVIQEVLKPVPAVLLRDRFGLTESIDGLVLGVAAGLGFAAAETLIRFSDVIAALPVRTDPANWIYPLLTLGIALPLLHGSTTGVIATALWRIGRHDWGVQEVGAIVAAVLAHVAFTLGSQLLTNAEVAQILVLAWQGAVVAGLLILVRYELHHALIAEARNLGFSERECPNCDRFVVASGFCPNCGMSASAAPLYLWANSQPSRPTDDLATAGEDA